MDRLTSMAAFVKAADAGSFTAAAEALAISPQMVAKHVTYLEDRIGTRLLNRTTRRQRLTELGRSYLERCKIVLADAEWSDMLAAEVEAAPRGRLRINAPVSFGAQSLVPHVTRFLSQHPGVEVDLVLSDRFVDLVEEGFEAAFRIGELRDSTMIARPLAPFRLVACAAPAYLRERGTPTTPLELNDHECLGYANWPGPTSNEWLFTREGKSYEVLRKRTSFQVNNAMGLMSAALEGYGVVLLAEDLVRDALHSGRLVSLLPDFQAPSRPMHLIYLADRRQTPKLRSFIEATVEEFKPASAERSGRGASMGR